MKKKILAMLMIIFMCLPFMAPVTVHAASTDYKNWLQSDPEWGSISLGSSNCTMKSSGCLITAIAMLICHTGSADPSEFNPGTLANYLNNNGGFTSGGLLYWEKVNGAADDFKLYKYKVSLAGMTQAEKTATMAGYLNDGYAVVISVKNGGHWVALDRIEGSTVYIMDPSSDATDLYATFNADNVDRLTIYKGKHNSGTVIGDAGDSDNSGTSAVGTGKVNCSSLYVRSGAGTNNGIVTSISRNTEVTILGEALDNKGAKWYRVSVNGKAGYVCAQYITVTTSGSSDGSDSGSQETSGTGVVNCSSLNVRSGAGTNYSVVTTISRNQSVNLASKGKDSNGDIWYGITFTKSGKSYKGYVFAEYITLSGNNSSDSNSDSSDSTVSAEAVVNCAVLNIRSGAGTGHSLVGTLTRGTSVNIIGEAKDSGGILWYKISTGSTTGYVHSAYLTMKDQSDSSVNNGSSGSSEENGQKLQVIYDGVNMRKTAGLSGSVVEIIYLEDTLSVLGQEKDSSGNVWYKVKASSGNTGYIRYDMVKEAVTSSDQSSDNQETVSGTVVGGWLNVRSGAGTTYAVLTVIPEGTRVTITETVKDSSGSQWYHITVSYGGSNYNGFVFAQYIQK